MAGTEKIVERAEYESRLQRDLEFLESPFIRQAEEIGVSRETLSKWREEIGAEKIVEWAVKLYRREFPAVASALLKRIKKTGDPNACELWMARFEGWLKKSEVHHTVQTEPIVIYDADKMLERYTDAAALNSFINTCRVKLEQLALNIGIGYFPVNEPINLSIEGLERMIAEGRYPFRMPPNDPALDPVRLQRYGFNDGTRPGLELPKLTTGEAPVSEGQKVEGNGSIRANVGDLGI